MVTATFLPLCKLHLIKCQLGDINAAGKCPIHYINDFCEMWL